MDAMARNTRLPKQVGYTEVGFLQVHHRKKQVTVWKKLCKIQMIAWISGFVCPQADIISTCWVDA